MTMSAFGAIALILASIGLYGVVAYAAEQRTREIGVRVALGAKRADVIRLVARQGMKLAIIGVLFGIAGAALVMPVMRSVLFGASPFNAAVFAAAVLILIAVALFASYLPARRATLVDPMVALRSE
jgi:putative ABC transport system permease protein